LAQDPYLVSQMNPEQYVSIYTIANFNAIKKLTSDINQVIEALKGKRRTVLTIFYSNLRIKPVFYSNLLIKLGVHYLLLSGITAERNTQAKDSNFVEVEARS